MSAVPSPVHADFVIELFGDGISRVDQVAFRLGIADDENDASEPVSQDFETVSFFNVGADVSHHFASLPASSSETMRAPTQRREVITWRNGISVLTTS